MAKNSPQETPFNEEQITSNKVIHRLHRTELYDAILRTQDEGTSPTASPKLIRGLIEDETILRPIICFVKGTYDAKSALGMFREKIADKLDRFDEFVDIVGLLFDELVKIIEAITSVKKKTKKKVEKVLKPKTVPKATPSKTLVELEELALIQLQKNEPVKISNSKQLRMTIKREGKRMNHKIDIERKGKKILVSCPTSDAKKGKQLTLTINKGELFILGKYDASETSRSEANMAQAAVDSAMIELTNAQNAKTQADNRIKNSLEGQEIQILIDIIEVKLAKTNSILKKANNNPLIHWFTAKKSPDISEEHIVIELTKKGVIVVTDEGEQCTATLRRVI